MAEKKEDPVVADEGPAREPPPSAARQKTFAAENGAILDNDTKQAILRLVMMEVGKTVTTAEGEEVRPVILENQTTGEVSVHLDNIDNPDVIRHIYNIVSNRRASLNEPANSSKR
jgi:hypothetical protein